MTKIKKNIYHISGGLLIGIVTQFIVYLGREITTLNQTYGHVFFCLFVGIPVALLFENALKKKTERGKREL